MPTDEEKMVKTLLDTNWRTTSLNPKPFFIWDDTMKTVDTRVGSVKIYYKDSPPIKWHGLGATTKEAHFKLILDVKAESRDRVLTIRDEIVRILDLKRIQPTPAYDYLRYSEGTKVNSYIRNYRWQFMVELVQLRRPIGVI